MARRRVSGARTLMSIINYTNIRYAGGAVPQGSSDFFSAVTLYTARPTITNTNISLLRRHGWNRGGHRGRHGLVPRGRLGRAAR